MGVVTSPKTYPDRLVTPVFVLDDKSRHRNEVSLRLENIVPHRKSNQVSDRRQLQFHHYSCAICFRGPDTDIHFVANVFVAFTICQQF